MYASGHEHQCARSGIVQAQFPCFDWLIPGLTTRPLEIPRVTKVDEDAKPIGSPQNVSVVQIAVVNAMLGEPTQGLGEAPVEASVRPQSRSFLIYVTTLLAESDHSRISGAAICCPPLGETGRAPRNFINCMADGER